MISIQTPMLMTPSRLQYLLEKYLDGTATDAEQAAYHQWYEQQSNPDGHLFTAEEADDMYQVIAAGIGARKKVHYLRWITAAAAAVVVIALGMWWISGITSSPIRPVLAEKKPSTPDTTVVQNTLAQPQALNLPDGSQVVLYPSASIRYATPFGAKDRTIWLQGKGFFNVVRNAPLPFTVISEGIATTALGTSFTIYSAHREVKVLLHTGKVMVKSITQTRYLQPGQQLSCNITTGIARVQPQPARSGVTPVIAFGSLQGFTAAFDQTPLSAVLDSIAAGYHIQISHQPHVFEDIAFSGMIRGTDSLAQVLHRMAMLHDLKIISTSTGYRIEKK
ncbi:FecR family protein [Chitinophaga polysaccharea]|uniref:FecR domain-containing protein n=1 Tax=Chitinophaga polysaccharea TaxID=1293035 RepID=UPI00145518D3|nr:FecR family protein [Chitinophaga polysaccharea]